jgi:arabinose-5-phosphate isomerase
MHTRDEIPWVLEGAPIIEVLEEMTEKKLGMTCVVDWKKRLLGVITDGDLRRMMRKHREGAFRKTAGEVMTQTPITIEKEGLAAEALNLMEKKKITSLVIKKPDGRVDGIIHLHDLWRTELF